MEQVPDVVRIEMVVFQIMDLGRAWLFGQPLRSPNMLHRTSRALAQMTAQMTAADPQKKINTSITR